MPRGLVYNISDIEKKAGISFKDKYTETKSIRKTGEFFGKFAGVYALSYSFIRYILKNQGVILNNRGGKHQRYTYREDKNAI